MTLDLLFGQLSVAGQTFNMSSLEEAKKSWDRGKLILRDAAATPHATFDHIYDMFSYAENFNLLR